MFDFRSIVLFTASDDAVRLVQLLVLLSFGIASKPFWFRVLVIKVAGVVSVLLFPSVLRVCDRLFVREVSCPFLPGFVGFTGE